MVLLGCQREETMGGAGVEAASVPGTPCNWQAEWCVWDKTFGIVGGAPFRVSLCALEVILGQLCLCVCE